MNEPFLPLPIPSPPESGFGAILARLAATSAGFLRRRVAGPARHRARRETEPRLACRSVPRRQRGRQVRFPFVPPAV